MNFHRVALSIVAILLLAISGSAAAALTASSTDTTTTIGQALPGQGSIVGELLLGSTTPVISVLPSLATTTGAATTTPGLGALSEHNKVSITGSCMVTQSANAKQCAIYVTYTTPGGDPVLGIPVTIRTMNAEGSFVDIDGPLFIQEGPGKAVQYSGILPGVSAVDVATWVGPATATSTLFVVTTPDGLRAQSTFASSTATR